MIRDGERSTGDLDAIFTFQEMGFKYIIEGYAGRYSENAIQVSFYLPKEN